MVAGEAKKKPVSMPLSDRKVSNSPQKNMVRRAFESYKATDKNVFSSSEKKDKTNAASFLSTTQVGFVFAFCFGFAFEDAVNR